MSTSQQGPADAGPEPGGPGTDPADRREWWATLEHDALEDETRANRRAERWLLVSFAVAVVLTVLVLVAHPGPLLS